MKRWLSLALLNVGAAVLLAAWLVLEARPTTDAVTLAPPLQSPAATVQAVAQVAPLAPAAVAPPPTPKVALAVAEPEPELNAQEAQMLMQLMAEQGDPRSPPLGTLKPREQASPAMLADPKQYSAFEDKHSRSLVMAYAGGVQQIPAIRERIEQAAQSGERSAAEIIEARAALEQLEMLQSKLQREAPELLPSEPALAVP
ncbi:hypothetical protein [Pseudomonas sp.]|uniref:hypothetical protein n=1 Tax=Pseudomonas sp. TaxID=306 RepID=UPI0027323DB6|nr:hypothetical protein [Pseudomonas sp.]MDP3816444.1 hypothetical protein [Pseudomonas sp.]